MCADKPTTQKNICRKTLAKISPPAFNRANPAGQTDAIITVSKLTIHSVHPGLPKCLATPFEIAQRTLEVESA